MNIFDIFKKRDIEDEIEEWFLNQKVENLFNFMMYKLMENKKPVKLCVMWLDVKYTITCELTEDALKDIKNE